MTPYHPQGEYKQWSRYISADMHAYKNTENHATGYSMYMLMFGREAQLPVDLGFGTSLVQTFVASHRGYVILSETKDGFCEGPGHIRHLRSVA